MKVVLARDPEAGREPWHMFLGPDDDYIVPPEKLVIEYVNGIATGRRVAHRVPLPREAPMLRDPELSAILDQATRNLNSLELLVRTSGEDDLSAISPLRQRLEALQIAYMNETNALTRRVIEHAIDRRVTTDRRGRTKTRSA